MQDFFFKSGVNLNFEPIKRKFQKSTNIFFRVKDTFQIRKLKKVFMAKQFKRHWLLCAFAKWIGSGVIVLINEDKKGFASVRQYSGLTLPEVTVVIDRISEIHAATAAMFLSKNSKNFENKKDFLLKCDENNPENTDATSLAAVRQDTDLVLRTLAHFLRRVPGYLEKHQLICKYKHILVEHLMQSNR